MQSDEKPIKVQILKDKNAPFNHDLVQVRTLSDGTLVFSGPKDDSMKVLESYIKKPQKASKI